MNSKQFYDTTKLLIDELFTFTHDKDKAHIPEFWKYAHKLKDEIDRVEELLKNR